MSKNISIILYLQRSLYRSKYYYTCSGSPTAKNINKYKNDESKAIETFDIDLDSANEQVDSLKAYKSNRDNISVQTKLNKLKKLAKSNDNIVPGLIKCIHSQCTLGEMSDALREIFGDYSK